MRSSRVAMAFTCLVVLAACGGGDGDDDAARPTSPTATASASAGPSASPTPSASASASASARPSATGLPTPVRTSVADYFVRAERVAAVHRSATGPAVATAAVRALLAGPTAQERRDGLSTAVPAASALRSLRIVDGVAVVDLTGAFASGGGSLSMGERLAQLVTTVTQFPSSPKVRLWLDGRPATALGGEGLIVDRPLGRADVEQWLPAILVDTPANGDRITSPVRVRGSANVFEAVLFVEITDWDGRIVASRRVMASSGTGTRGSFDVVVSYDVDRAGPAELIAYSRSPKDGSRINVVETLLTVAP